jgi:hypothetical protein
VITSPGFAASSVFFSAVNAPVSDAAANTFTLPLTVSALGVLVGDDPVDDFELLPQPVATAMTTSDDARSLK